MVYGQNSSAVELNKFRDWQLSMCYALFLCMFEAIALSVNVHNSEYEGHEHTITDQHQMQSAYVDVQILVYCDIIILTANTLLACVR